MGRLPAIKPLAIALANSKQGRQRVSKSIVFLNDRQASLAAFRSVEELAEFTDPELAPEGTPSQVVEEARALAHHLTTVRSALAQELWTREIFIGADVLDELTYLAASDPKTTDPIYEVLSKIRDSRARLRSLLLFPVHSMGILGAGVLLSRRRSKLAIINEKNGYAITPQTNSMPRTISFLSDVGESFRIGKRIPAHLLEHWRLSRGADWLQDNPLLAIRVAQFAGSYYANEWLLLSRIRATNALLCMLAAMQPPPEDRPGSLFSSRIVNNWQTLDIHHYIVLFPGPRGRSELDGRCIPINRGKQALSELSSLAIELNPRTWKPPKAGR